MNFYYSGEKLLIISQKDFWTPSVDKRWQLIEKRVMVALPGIEPGFED